MNQLINRYFVNIKSEFDSLPLNFLTMTAVRYSLSQTKHFIRNHFQQHSFFRVFTSYLLAHLLFGNGYACSRSSFTIKTFSDSITKVFLM